MADAAFVLTTQTTQISLGQSVTQFVLRSTGVTSGASTLDELADVDTAGAVPGQVLGVLEDETWGPVDQSASGDVLTTGVGIDPAGGLRTTLDNLGFTEVDDVDEASSLALYVGSIANQSAANTAAALETHTDDDTAHDIPGQIAAAEAGYPRAIEQKSLSPMQNWHTARGRAGKDASPEAVDVLVIGDSITEGYGSTVADYRNSYLSRFATQLGARLNPDGRTGRGWVPAGSDFTVSPKFSTNGTATEANKGISLRARVMAAGDPAATITVDDCDRIEVHYRESNVFAVGHLRITLDGVPFDFNTYNGAIPGGGDTIAVWDSGALDRGTHTLSVQQLTFGAFTGPATWDGAYFFDGEHDSGVRVWNGSHFGYNTGAWLTFDPTLNNDAWSAVRDGAIVPSLIIDAMFNNDQIASDEDFEAGKRLFYEQMQEVFDTLGAPMPSVALLWGPASDSRSNASIQAKRDMAYAFALEFGFEVWDWGELSGPVDTVDGDPYGFTVDATHPNDTGHDALGRFVADRALTDYQGRDRSALSTSDPRATRTIFKTVAANSSSLTGTLDIIGGSRERFCTDWLGELPDGFKWEARVVTFFQNYGWVAGDVLESDLYDMTGGAQVVLATGVVESPATANQVAVATSSWVDVPDIPKDCVMRSRNATAARGGNQTCNVEYRAVPS